MNKIAKIALILSGVVLLNTGCTEKELNAAMKQATDAAGAYQSGGGMSQDLIGKGLKAALEQGVGNGVDLLSARNGFWSDMARRILLPPEAREVESKLRQLGMGKLADKCLEDINHAAEDAAIGARPIFVTAITSMTFNDAKNILMGDRNAATQYLQRVCTAQLYESFKPVIFESLNKVGAMKTWKDVMTTYNSIPLVKKVNPDLADHVTNKAMEGLFQMIEKEELSIRKDPLQRTTALLKKVFAAQDR
jgi:Protein of unknown function (DUF4197)